MPLRILLVLFIAILLGACRTPVPIYQVQDATVATNAPNASKDDVAKAIIRAGGSLGWVIRHNGPNALIGTLNLRTHTAIVDIPYSIKSYSILYKDSADLNYTGTAIHSNYNGWIQNLQKNIDFQLNTL